VFRAVAVEPAFDPVEAYGEPQEVGSAGFLMLGLFFTIFVPAADELRTLRASFFDESDPEADGPEAFVAGAQAWIAQVEADPAFMVPMTRHQAERFQFAIDAIG
jgi:hypothetical protein